MPRRRIAPCAFALLFGGGCGGGTSDAPMDATPSADSTTDASEHDGGSNDGVIFDAVDDGTTPTLPTGKAQIGFWCGVPQAFLARSAFDDIAAAGFTFVTNACDGTTFQSTYDLTMLDLAHQAGLEAIVVDTRISDALAGTAVDTNLDAVVHDYASAPGLLGYFLVDEPNAGAFPAIATVVSGLRARDGKRLPYVNLLPNYATTAQLGTATYDDYVAQFLATTHAPIFSWDHYNFLADGTDDTTFFSNLAVARAHALSTSTPFWQIVQSIAYTAHRTPTAAEKRWAAMHTLAYGASGVMWFTYWTPPATSESFGDALVDRSGAHTAQWGEVQAINHDVQAIGRFLVAAKSIDVFHVGPLADGAVPRVPGASVYVPSAAPITVGRFSVGADEYALLVNRDHASTTESDVYVVSSDGSVRALDVTKGTFAPLTPVARDAIGTKLHVSLAAGDALLLHLPGPVPKGPPGAEAYFGTVRSDAGWLDVVDARFGTARLRTDGWNDCPAGTTMIGRDFQSNGFWLCARADLAARTFHVGNVVSDAGTLYRVQGGTATSEGPGGWDTCPAGTLLGHRFESNGFWLCME